MITRIGKRNDGSWLGEDESGALFIGTPKKVGYDSLTRTVADEVETLTYGEFVYGKGNVEGEPPSVGPMEKQFHQVIVVRDGVETEETREKMIDVIDWVSMS